MHKPQSRAFKFKMFAQQSSAVPSLTRPFGDYVHEYVQTPGAPCSTTCLCKTCVEERMFEEMILEEIQTPRAPCSMTCPCKVCVEERMFDDIQTPGAPCPPLCLCKVCVDERIAEVDEDYCCACDCELCRIPTPELDMNVECLCECRECFKSIELGIICHCKTTVDTSVGSMIEPLQESRKFFAPIDEYDYEEAFEEDYDY
jgi:hypothetical protein